MTTKTTREAKSRLEKFYDERVISFGGKGKKFWVKLYEKDVLSLLKEQREEQVKEVGTLLVVDVEQEIKPYDAQLIMEMKANHNEMVRKYNLAITKVLSILKGKKK